jgi:NAD(P)-dependent dehydrogenase (short-subunit alcohol dehydrogenase family)
VPIWRPERDPTCVRRDQLCLFCAGCDQKSVDQAKELLCESAVAVRADVTKLGDLDALYARVRDEFGRIDVLFARQA